MQILQTLHEIGIVTQCATSNTPNTMGVEI
jgi:hypothetical protein